MLFIPAKPQQYYIIEAIDRCFEALIYTQYERKKGIMISDSAQSSAIETLSSIYKRRPDLQDIYLESDIDSLLIWAVTWGSTVDSDSNMLRPIANDLVSSLKNKYGNDYIIEILVHIYSRRPDLQEAYPEASHGDLRRLIQWALIHSISISPKETLFELFPKELTSALKSSYGKDFIFDIDPRDEMFQYTVAHPELKDPAVQYLISGFEMLWQLEGILDDLDMNFKHIDSLLDFASGYGRLTRFLIQKIDKEKICVSDIDKNAVDFCKKTFGVKGFYSVSNPNALIHEKKYDVIFVASLFSHLALPLWQGWLKRLYDMLNREGILIFSTHGYDNYCNQDQNFGGKEGFRYVEQSETTRLPENEYGTAYVSRNYVENFTRENHLGKVLAYYPKTLWSFQDVFVIQKQAKKPRWRIGFLSRDSRL
jgi:SAM-dependent methyltransferase